LKLDCEGAEFPILLTSQLLHLVESICGEFHEIGGAHASTLSIPDHFCLEGYSKFTISELGSYLRRQGYRVTWRRLGGSNLGLFYASRSLRTYLRYVVGCQIVKGKEWLGG
jgi:hypothetical protein